VGQGRQELVLAAVGLAQGLLGPLLGGNIARDFRGADDTVARVPDRRDSHGNVESPAILGDSNRVEVLDPLTAADPLQDHSLLVAAIWRDDEHDGLTNRLGRGIAEYAFGAGVPGKNDPFERLADDGVLGGVHDGGQKRLGLEAVTQLVLAVAGPQSRPHGADQGRHADGALQQSHVSQAGQGRRDGRGVSARAR
jgi:hypothetical protein